MVIVDYRRMIENWVLWTYELPVRERQKLAWAVYFRRCPGLGEARYWPSKDTEDTVGTQPGACLMALPDQRPCGLPSHVARLNGAGHTGRPALDVLKWASFGNCSCIALPPASLQSCPFVP